MEENEQEALPPEGELDEEYSEFEPQTPERVESKEQLGHNLLKVTYRMCETIVPVKHEVWQQGRKIGEKIIHKRVRIPYPELSLPDKVKSNLDTGQIAYLMRLSMYYTKILDMAERYKRDMRPWARKIASIYWEYINLNKSKAMQIPILSKTDYQISEQTSKRFMTPQEQAAYGMRPQKKDMWAALRPKFKEPKEI